MHPDTLATTAARQLQDLDSREPGTVFREGLQLSLEEAYAVQHATTALRTDRGEVPCGYKVGCTSATIQQQLNVDNPIYGRVWSAECHASPAVLPLANYPYLAIEGELAVRLAGTISANTSPTDIPSQVAAALPVIELHHAVIRGRTHRAAEVIANNGMQAGIVQPSATVRLLDLQEQRLAIRIGEEVVAFVRGDLLIRTAIASLHWLADCLEAENRSLVEGDVVLTGSIPKLFYLTDPTAVEVSIGDVSVQAEFVA